ncbi:putative esterase [Naviculisporaceae sp. PSN 640]
MNTIPRVSPRHFNFVKSVLGSFQKESGLERTLFGDGARPRKDGKSTLVLTAAREGSVRFTVDLQGRHTNRLNILHGGVIASLVDFGGSLAVASKGLFSTGVSTDINVSYLGSGGKAGDKITVSARCDKVGGTLAFTTVHIYSGKGELVARGSHTKWIKAAQETQTFIGGPFKLPGHVQAELDKLEASRAANLAEGAAADAVHGCRASEPGR